MSSITVQGVNTPLLAPVVALNLWVFFIEAWLYATRIPAVNKLKVPLRNTATKEQFSAMIPPKIRWKADNYNHLQEQPTQFYAIAIVLALLGEASGVGSLEEKLAWAYVGIRIAHSLLHCIVNIILVRFALFALSSFVLLGMTARAAVLVF